MQKVILVPRGTDFGGDTIDRLKKDCPFLTDKHIELTKYWCEQGSVFTGTVIKKGSKFTVFPYDSDADRFHEEYGPDTEVWE